MVKCQGSSLVFQNDQISRVPFGFKRVRIPRVPPWDQKCSNPKGPPLGGRREKQRTARAATAARTQPPPPSTEGTKKKGKGGKSLPTEKAAGATPKSNPAKRKVRQRPPKTAAITLTLQEGASVTYAEAMTEARKKIDLQGLGIG